MIRFLLVLTLVVSASITGLAQSKCADTLYGSQSKDSRTTLSQLTIDQYLKKSFLEGPRALEEEWIHYVRIILTMDRQSFVKLIPKTTYPKADVKSEKIYFSSMKKGIRSLDPREGILNYFSPYFFHMTKKTNTENILEEGFRLSRGSHNLAAICLGDAGFRKFQSKSDLNILRATLHKDAKILDLTQEPFGTAKATDYSYYGAFEWYKENFLPSLIKGEYAKVFPEFTAHAQEYYQSTGLISSALYSKEAFGLLVGADVLYVSETYSPLRLDEYWVINPDAISEVEIYR